VLLQSSLGIGKASFQMHFRLAKMIKLCANLNFRKSYYLNWRLSSLLIM